jgi:pyruvate kinase
MIARGDLAVELGFARLSEMQEEILWLCEAAHAPVIWATQVLDQLVHEGVASRAEATDAAMAQKADCVMLNKGEFLTGGVRFLRDVLDRMERHHAKKFARLSQLQAWR